MRLSAPLHFGSRLWRNLLLRSGANMEGIGGIGCPPASVITTCPSFYPPVLGSDVTVVTFPRTPSSLPLG